MVDVDVVIAGSGAAGLTAAWAAADAGLAVLVVEKSDWIGGTSALSGGAFWVPANPCQPGLGVSDNADAARTYLRDMLGNDYEAEKIDAYLAAAPQVVGALMARGALDCLSFGTTDYEPWRPGASIGRSLSPLPYDARRLGAWRMKLRPPLAQMTIFGGMQIDFADVGDYLALLRSPAAAWRSAKRYGRHLADRLLRGRATRLTNGNALAGRLLETALAAGVEIWTDAPVEGLEVADGRVTGLSVRRGGETIAIRARRGVILATGGYGGNAALRARTMPSGGRALSLQPPDNVGDGIALGEGAGGQFVTDNVANGIWQPMSVRAGGDGAVIGFPHLMDRYKPGFLVVAQDGRRFVNEGTSYHSFGAEMHARGIERAWLIGGHRAVRRWGIGMALPAPLPLGAHLRSGYLRRGRSIGQLADAIGVDPATLAETVRRFDDHAARGADPDFRRGEDGYSRGLGDPTHTPNPSLGPLGPGPYYAVELRHGELSTLNGLRTDAQTRVLDADGRPIPGLHAIGIDANSLFRGHYPGGGSSLGPAMAFGYIAGRHLAERTAATP